MKKAIKCGKLFDSNKGAILKDQIIIIDGERVTDITPLEGFNGEGLEVTDLSDKFVMPGLIDCHTHVSSRGEANSFVRRLTETIGDLTLTGLKNAQSHLMSGFTTIRDVGSIGFLDVSIRNAINKGDFPGPRMAVSGPCIGSTGSHADNHLNPYFHCDLDHTHIIDSPYQARKAARYIIKHGADLIKFMSTGGVMSRGTTLGAQQLTYDEMSAIIEVANMYGVHTATHAHGTEGIRAAVKAGVSSVEHGMIMEEDIIELMAEKGTYLTPTIIAARRIVDNGVKMGIEDWAVEKAKQALAKHQWGFKRCLEMGVNIAFGTDCGTPFNIHGQQFDEFLYLCEFGMTPLQTLTAATKTAAKLLRKWEDIGSLCPGKYADIVAYPADPTDDMKIMSQCAFIMKGGVVYKR